MLKKAAGENAEHSDFWLIKTDSDGNKIWDKTYGEKDDSETGFSVQQTTDRGYIFTGLEERPSGSKIWLIKTDDNGEKIWDRTFGRIGYDHGFSSHIFKMLGVYKIIS